MNKRKIRSGPHTFISFYWIAICLILAAGLVSCKQDEIEVKPNIVLILVENISTEIGCYGDPYGKTPTIDNLASEGIRYTRAFTTSSVCAPSRAAMMTGSYQIRTNTQNLRIGNGVVRLR